MAQVQWGDFPTWVAAVGTVGAVIVALVLSTRDSRRLTKTERRHQAELVTAWFGAEKAGNVTIQNASQQSVYLFIASLVAVQGAFRETAVGDTTDQLKHRAFVGQVPPGQSTTRLPLDHGMYVRFGVEIAFKDAAGRNWVRFSQGELKEFKDDPVALYKVPIPIEWEVG